MLLFTRAIRLFSLLAMMSVLASCGGGGTGSPLDNNGGGSPDPTDDSPVLGGSIQMTMEDESNPGVEITSISSTTPGLLLITLLDEDGNPVANEIVQLEIVLGAGALSASTALTNSSGVANVDVNVADGDSPGAGGRVRAWYEANSGDTVEGFYNYEVVNSGTTSTAGFSVSVELFETGVDISSGTPVGAVTNTVSAANPGTLVIILTDTVTSNPIANAIVSVTTDVGVLSPESGKVLTNSNGIATITVTSDDTSAAGAGTLVATVGDVVTTRNFSVGSVPLQLGRDDNGYLDVNNSLDFIEGEITISNNNISASGATSLRVVVADENGNVYTQPVTVNFASNCSVAGTAQIETGITTSNGVAVATYQASSLCSGQTDTVTAVIEEVSGASATGTITIAASVANSVQFLDATPEFMKIKGAGDDSSLLRFVVLNDGGDPQVGETVSFSLTTTVGGITLTNTSSDTDGDGIATVRVNAGTVATPVRVVASISGGGTPISTVSEALTITTGLPDQNSFSLSATTLNPGGNNVDGVESILTIRAGDSVNNPVPDGTTINFTTEYGRITSPDTGETTAACQTVNGTCSVVWNSQNPRSGNGYPASIGTPLRLDNSNHVCLVDIAGTDAPSPDEVSGIPCAAFLRNTLDPGYGTDTDDPGQIFGGRTTVLAYATGEEWFDDANGNGLYDYVDVNDNGSYEAGTDTLEGFTDLPEAYRDDNEDGVFGNETTPGGCDNPSGDGGVTATATECSSWQLGGAVEPFIDLNSNSQYDGDEASPDPLAGHNVAFRDGFGNGIYNGVRCASEMEALGLCSSDLVTVRSSAALIAGGATAKVSVYRPAVGGPEYLLPDGDVDGDGIFDPAEDVDGDGKLDLVDEDTNGNDMLDGGEDLDMDGNLDVNEDVNGVGTVSANGILDPGEDEFDWDVDLVNYPEDNTRLIYVSDIFNGYLPSGTTITVSSNNCKVFGITEYEISNTNAYGITSFTLSFAEDTTTDNSSDTIDIEITPPDGVGGGVVNKSFLCKDAD